MDISTAARYGLVRIRFSEPTQEFGLSPEQVHTFVEDLMEKARQASKQETLEQVEAQKPDISQPIVGKCTFCGCPKRANEIKCPSCGLP